MAKPARRLAFALKAAQPFGVAAHFRRQQLDCDPITQQNVPRAINGAHPTFSQNALNLVLAVEHSSDYRGGILFQNFSVVGTEANAIFEFLFAGQAKFHWRASLQRRRLWGE